MFSRLRALLPESRPLPENLWARRHRALLMILWLHVPALFLFALSQGGSFSHALLEAVMVGLPAVVGSVPALSRNVRAMACSLGLIIASSVLVHLAHGQIEAHFHFFVVISLVTLYQSMRPFALAFAWVLLHHGVAGTLMPHSVYNHASAWESPWIWASIHAGFIGASSLVAVIIWKANESLARVMQGATERHQAVLDSLEEGVILVDIHERTVRFANQAALLLVGADLVGLPHGNLLHPGKKCTVDCPFEGALTGPVRSEPQEVALSRSDTSSFPAELVAVRSEDSSVPGVILTFHDRTEREQLHQAAREVERLSELERSQRSQVLALQETLRPSRPELGGALLGVHYVPAAGAPVGGDFYDWVLLPDGDLHVVVVDVMGKGLAATKDALGVTSTLRTLALEGVPLGELVERTDRLLSSQAPEMMATLVVARYTPATGVLLLAGASHPPSLLLRSGDGVEELPAPGLALGYPGAGSESVMRHQLLPGDTVVFYTDGLVEGTRDISVGLEALKVSGTTHKALEVSALAETLVMEAIDASDHQDDSLALVLRRELPVDIVLPQQSSKAAALAAVRFLSE